LPAGLCVNIEPLSSLDEVLPLLAGCDLPVADLSSSPSPPYFFGVRAAGALVGVVGLEIFQSVGLLRSLAISPDFRGRGHARDLVRFVERFAAARGVELIFLLTTTAEAWFTALAYTAISRQQAPESIRATRQFSTLCPSTSALMSKTVATGTVPSSAQLPSAGIAKSNVSR